MTLNDPAVVQVLEQMHDAYERALVANDIVALNSCFWDSGQVVRYGVSEQLYGTDELLAYRQGPVPSFTDRRIVRRAISTFDATLATVMSEIAFLANGVPRRIRQSQTWVQLPDVGWRVVAAHVSVPLAPVAADFPWGAYADSMARTLGLPLAAAHRPGVVVNLERTAAIAAPLLAFALPDDVEPASVFTP